MNLSLAGEAVRADVWLGGSDKESEGRWTWVDGTPINMRS